MTGVCGAAEIRFGPSIVGAQRRVEFLFFR